MIRTIIDHDGNSDLVRTVVDTVRAGIITTPQVLDAVDREARWAYATYKDGDPGWLVVADGRVFQAPDGVVLWELLRRNTPVLHAVVDLAKVRRQAGR